MKRSKLKYWLIAAAAILLFAAGWYCTALSTAYQGVVEEVPTPSIDEQPIAKGAYNLLLIGTDGSDTLTDTIMLVRMDLDNSKIALLSLMRDTCVRLGKGFGKLNAVYGRDGIDGLISCVKELTGAPVHYYAMVDLTAFKTVVDRLGGVEFDVPRDMHYHDDVQDLYIDLKAGQQHLDGEHAMQLVRFRRYAEGDVQRTRVQQQFVKALIEQKLKPENLLKAPALFNELQGELKTNITLSDILEKRQALRLFDTEDAIEICEMPGEGRYIGSVSYFVHREEELYDLCREHFGGEGAPDILVYTNGAAAALAQRTPKQEKSPETPVPVEETAPPENPAEQTQEPSQEDVPSEEEQPVSQEPPEEPQEGSSEDEQEDPAEEEPVPQEEQGGSEEEQEAEPEPSEEEMLPRG